MGNYTCTLVPMLSTIKNTPFNIQTADISPSLGRAEASPTLFTHTRKSLYLCMCVCMYVCMNVCMYVCLYVYYVAIRRPRVHRALYACAYRNSVKIVNVENSLLKGRRSRFYKQYTSLQSYYDHSL